MNLSMTRLLAMLIVAITSPATLAETSTTAQVRPKVLLFSAIDVDYLNDTLARRGNVFGVDGFMLAYIGDWWSQDSEISKNENRLARLTALGSKCGIDSNFLKVALGYRVIPEWEDENGWAQIERNIAAIAALAQRTGLKGLAIDTENYRNQLWADRSLFSKQTNKSQTRALVRKRGAQLMQAISTAHPSATTILLQEGAFWWYQRREKSYEFWMDFYNGLASVRPEGGLVIGSESTYSLTEPRDISARVTELRETMLQHAEDRAYWQGRGSVAVGMWPVGKAYDDKAARYPVAAFQQQFNAASDLSERYVWIYGHGSAWWQLTRDEIHRYTRQSHWIWGPEHQAIPTVPTLDEYRRVFAPQNISPCVVQE
jgi:hypothetical protein